MRYSLKTGIMVEEKPDDRKLSVAVTRKPRFSKTGNVFPCGRQDVENDDHLQRYLLDMTVSDNSCKVLGKSGTTTHVIHRTFVSK